MLQTTALFNSYGKLRVPRRSDSLRLIGQSKSRFVKETENVIQNNTSSCSCSDPV